MGVKFHPTYRGHMSLHSVGLLECVICPSKLFLQPVSVTWIIPRWALSPVISGVLTPISRLKFHPLSQFFSVIYKGDNPTYNDRRGPPCTQNIMYLHGWCVLMINVSQTVRIQMPPDRVGLMVSFPSICHRIWIGEFSLSCRIFRMILRDKEVQKPWDFRFQKLANVCNGVPQDKSKRQISKSEPCKNANRRTIQCFREPIHIICFNDHNVLNPPKSFFFVCVFIAALFWSQSFCSAESHRIDMTWHLWHLWRREFLQKTAGKQSVGGLSDWFYSRIFLSFQSQHIPIVLITVKYSSININHL